MDKKINNIKEFIFLIQLDWLTNTHTHINTFHHCVNYHNRTKKKSNVKHDRSVFGTWCETVGHVSPSCQNMNEDQSAGGVSYTLIGTRHHPDECFSNVSLMSFFWWEEAPGRRKRNADNYSAVHLHSAPSSAHRRDAGVVCICVCVWETHTHRYTLCVLQCTAWYHLSVLLQ